MPIRASHELPCAECYQYEPCQMVGKQVYASSIFDGNDQAPASPAACFFHCCRDGVKSAKIELRQARHEGVSGILPFGTEHKPYIDREGFSGRFVARNAEHLGLNNGDVVVRVKGDLVTVTNVFQCHPPK